VPHWQTGDHFDRANENLDPLVIEEAALLGIPSLVLDGANDLSRLAAGVDPSIFVTYFNLPTVAGAKAIVVTPQCLGGAAAWSESRDLPLFDALLAKMQGAFCIDNQRIFAAGHSSGGMFTHMLGCRRGNVLRGIGPLSAPPPSGTCTGDVAVWISQGISDPTVTVDLGRSSRDFWVKRNHCDASQSTAVDPAPTVAYGGCDAGFPVRYCEYDGNHNLPSYAPKAIWDFFNEL
jgi:polyhydroxybutyrate depolymerase